MVGPGTCSTGIPRGHPELHRAPWATASDFVESNMDLTPYAFEIILDLQAR
jgi:hypothetical protein